MKSTVKDRLEALEEAARRRGGQEAADMARIRYFFERMTPEEKDHAIQTGQLPARLGEDCP